MEEGPREGFQSESNVISTENKIRFIEALARTGVDEINCVSFVDARRVPQMADAPEVARQIQKQDGVKYTATWLNPRGLERAADTKLDLVGKIFLSASDAFSIRNSNRDRQGTIADQTIMLGAYRSFGVPLEKAYVFTAFGCNYEGEVSIERVLQAVDDLLALARGAGEPIPRVVLCDTVGFANPLGVARVLDAVRCRWPDLEIALHLHDTRGMGLANALMGLRLGVSHFDASCAGLGGCPFAGNKSAAGNICTEDLVLMCEEMGIETGIDLEGMIECARMAESIVGHPLPGKAMKAGSIASIKRAVRNV
jgi:hydroxymethylglutaryl-CoA lyase